MTQLPALKEYLHDVARQYDALTDLQTLLATTRAWLGVTSRMLAACVGHHNLPVVAVNAAPLPTSARKA